MSPAPVRDPAVAGTDRRSVTVVISTARQRRTEHAGLADARRVMVALGRSAAWVVGQLLPGVSVWTFSADAADVRGPGTPLAVVPGNTGSTETLRTVVSSIDAATPRDRGAGSPATT